MANQKFEIEHWPAYFGKWTLLRMLKGYIKVYTIVPAVFALSFGIAFISKAYLHFSIPYIHWVIRVSGYILIIAPFMPIISYLQRNKKMPSYGINKDGFLINERGWDAAFFTWKEIKSIKEFEHPKYGKELHFEFVSFTAALNKPGQDKFTQSLLREYEIEKHPKKISGQLVKGDMSAFIELFKKYFNAYRKEHPITSENS